MWMEKKSLTFLYRYPSKNVVLKCNDEQFIKFEKSVCVVDLNGFFP